MRYFLGIFKGTLENWYTYLLEQSKWIFQGKKIFYEVLCTTKWIRWRGDFKKTIVSIKFETRKAWHFVIKMLINRQINLDSLLISLYGNTLSTQKKQQLRRLRAFPETRKFLQGHSIRYVTQCNGGWPKTSTKDQAISLVLPRPSNQRTNRKPHLTI